MVIETIISLFENMRHSGIINQTEIIGVIKSFNYFEIEFELFDCSLGVILNNNEVCFVNLV